METGCVIASTGDLVGTGVDDLRCRLVGSAPQTRVDARHLHVQAWASLGISVVNRGDRLNDEWQPSAYLLLEPDDLVVFDPQGVIEGHPGHPTTMRIELDLAPPKAHAEFVSSDDSGRLLAIHRRYGRISTTRPEVVMTTDPTLAEAWRVDTKATLDWKDGIRFIQLTLPGIHIQRDEQRADNLVVQSFLKHGVDPRVDPRAADTGMSLAVPLASSRHSVGAVEQAGSASARSRNPAWRGQRLFSIVFSLVAMVLAAPLYPLIMLAILIEDGRPFFFSQKRQARGGADFDCFKFRTMYRNADSRKIDLDAQNTCDGPQFYIENDPRLLRVGRFLRRFHLDELPQFFNVLRGDMNVVGPRPSPDNENQFCPAWREARLSVRPGVTGLWQVSRTRALNRDFQEWIRYDMEYVNRCSFRLDMTIIMRTCHRMLWRR